MKNIYIAIQFCLLLLLTSCDKEDLNKYDQDKVDDRIIQNHLSENGISATKHSWGYYYEVINENPSGTQVGANEIAHIYYKICLTNGKVLESKSVGNSDPIRFLHADGGLIPTAINSGVGLMKTGEKYRFYIPSSMGLTSYFAVGYFGPNEVLIAEIELVSKETLLENRAVEDNAIKNYLLENNVTYYSDYSSGVYKYTKLAGTGSTPIGGCLIKVEMTRSYLDGTTIRSNASDSLYIPRFDGDNYYDVVQPTSGLREGLLNTQLGETSVILVPSHLAFGGTMIQYKDVNNITRYRGSIQIIPQKFRDDFVENYLKTQNIHPLSPIKYEIKLIGITQVK